MLLSLLATVLIILIALYLANQGMVSSLLALATATFSSILAMALMEPLQGIIGGWRPDYGRGVTFLLVFFLAFSLTRFIADMCVPKTIKLSLPINRLMGGFIGFFTGLVVVGTLVIGVDLLPVGRKPLGFDRFPGPGFMQALDGDNKPILGEVAKPHNIWFAPDRFVLAIWNGASHGSLGGNRAFSSVHPDLSVEAYGYRNHVDGSLRTMLGDLLHVKEAYWFGAETRILDYPGPDKHLLMVRTTVTKGDKVPMVSDTSSTTGSYFYVSASEVRLVTDKHHQYYPIGYLEQGLQFEPLPLDNGYVVDDYVKGKEAVDDWVFQVPLGETPLFIEVKQLARAPLGTVKEKPTLALAPGEYPAHAYFGNRCSLAVTFDPKAGGELKSAHVYVLSSDNRRSDIPDSAVNSAHTHIIQAGQDMNNNAGGWSDKGAPAVPSYSVFRSSQSLGQNMLNDPGDSAINWPGFVTQQLLGQVESDGQRNMRAVPEFVESTFIPMLKSAKKGSLIVASGTANAAGTAAIPKIEPGRHTVIITMVVAKEGVDRAFYVWVKDVNLGEKKLDSSGKEVLDKNGNPTLLNQDMRFTVSPTAADSPIFHLDLDEKVP